MMTASKLFFAGSILASLIATPVFAADAVSAITTQTVTGTDSPATCIRSVEKTWSNQKIASSQQYAAAIKSANADNAVAVKAAKDAYAAAFKAAAGKSKAIRSARTTRDTALSAAATKLKVAKKLALKQRTAADKEAKLEHDSAHKQCLPAKR